MAKKHFETERRKWDQLSLSGKLQYLWDYYKLPFVIAIILLYIVGHRIYLNITHKDAYFYAAMVNVAPSDALQEKLEDGFMQSLGLSSDNPAVFYKSLYLTDNISSEHYTYTQASQVKILSAINAGEMDMAFLDEEAFAAFAQNGFLYDLSRFFEEYGAAFPETEKTVPDHFVKNMVILEDNAKEVALDPSVSYSASTEEYFMGIDLTESRFFKDAGFSEPVYLAVIANTPRGEAVMTYIDYLFNEKERA